MKGICYFGMKGYEQSFIVQTVGKTVNMTTEEWEDEEPKTELVLIGTKMNKSKIIQQLKKLEDNSPDEITPENMVNFERFFLKNNKTDL